MDEAIEDADVIMMLRVQFERMSESFFPSVREYFRYCGLTANVWIARNRTSSSCIPARSTAASKSPRMLPTAILGNSRSGVVRRRRANGHPVPAAGGVMDLLIKNGRVVDPARKTRSRRRIFSCATERFAQSAASTSRTFPMFDATGLIVAPGFFDIHVHLREPGTEEAETIATGGQRPLPADLLAVAAMPNTKPPNDNPSITSYIISEANGRRRRGYFPSAPS